MISFRESIRRFVTGYTTPREKTAFVLGYVVSAVISGALIVGVHFLAGVV